MTTQKKSEKTTESQDGIPEVSTSVQSPKQSDMKWEKAKFDPDRVRSAGAAYAAGVAEVGEL